MRALFLRTLFVVGALVAFVFLTIPIFLRSFFRKARAFHPSGTVCTAEIISITSLTWPGDGHVRLEGTARVRFASATADENSLSPSIIGMSIKLGDDQDLALGTFESFAKAGEATKQTNVADYLVANQYASVAPWVVRGGLGVTWLRAIPDAVANTAKTGSRVERLRADIEAKRAKLVLEAHEKPGPDGKKVTLAMIELTGIEPADDPKFHISMFRHGRGIVATGFRNGVRAVVYPVSQFARGLRGS